MVYKTDIIDIIIKRSGVYRFESTATWSLSKPLICDKKTNDSELNLSIRSRFVVRGRKGKHHNNITITMSIIIFPLDIIAVHRSTARF